MGLCLQGVNRHMSVYRDPYQLPASYTERMVSIRYLAHRYKVATNGWRIDG